MGLALSFEQCTVGVMSMKEAKHERSPTLVSLVKIFLVNCDRHIIGCVYVIYMCDGLVCSI